MIMMITKEIIWVVIFIQARSPVRLEEPASTLPSPAGMCFHHKPLGAGAGPCWGLLACMQHECLLSWGTVLWGHRLVWTVCCPCPQHLGRQKHTHQVTVTGQGCSWGSREKSRTCSLWHPSEALERERDGPEIMPVSWMTADPGTCSPRPGWGDGGYFQCGAGAQPSCLHSHTVLSWRGSRTPNVVVWLVTAKLISLTGTEKQGLWWENGWSSQTIPLQSPSWGYSIQWW